MSAKKSAKGETKANDNWRKVIESANVNDVDFNFQAIVMEGAGNDQDQLYLSKFEAVAPDEKRSVIKNITKTETIFMVNQLGSEKKERDESLKVFEEAYDMMKENKKEIPTDILALLIKYQMMEMKKKYLIVQKEKRELKEGMKLESATMIDAYEVKGAVAQPPAPLEPPKPAKKGKKEPIEETVEPKEGKKYNTYLRERGEEWRDKTYVNDFPVDGPNVYVAITGFSEPLLLSGLMRIGIPLAAVVQVRIDPLNTTVPLSLMRTSKRGQSQSEVLTEQANRFWSKVQNLRIQPDIAYEYKDIAFIAFKPPYCEGDKLKGDAESIYDDISFLLYDIQDVSRQHNNYLENMNVVHIPEETPNIIYFNRYTEMANQIPNECTTVFFVLNNILNAIEESQDLTLKTNLVPTTMISKTGTPTSNIMPTAAVKEIHRIEKTQLLVEEVFHALQTTHEEKQKVSYLENEYVFPDPVVIDYGDYFSSNTFHFESNLDIEIIFNMLKGIPLCTMWDTVKKPSGDQKAKINYHLKVLMHSFGRDDIDYSKLYRLLNVLAFRKLFDNRCTSINTDCTQIKLDDFKKTYLKRSIFSEPLHKANSFSHVSSHTEASSTLSSIHEMSVTFSNSTVEPEQNCISNAILFECPDIGDLISPSEITSQKVDEHVIDDFEYFEDFNSKCSVQILHNVFSEFNCVNYKFCRVTDSILLLAYNSHNNGIFTKEWKTNLTTPVCMQDFFDFVLYEHYEWFQNEENAYENAMRSYYQMENVDDMGSASNRSCLEKSVLELDMMVEGSLKHDEFIKLQTTTAPSETTISTKKGKTKTVTPSSTNMTTSSKKSSTKGTKTSTISSYKGSSVNSETSLGEFNIKPFLGYDINNRRIEIFGRDASFFSEDGTKVITKYFTEFPECQEYVTLQVMSGKDTEICVHKPLGDYTKPILQETVRIFTKNNVQLHFKKQTYEEIPVITNESVMQDFEKRNNNKGLDNLNLEIDPVLIYFYSLVISSNNGLLVECIHDANSLSVLYIRQHYLIESTLVKDEEMRCISKAGEVVIFKKSGDIEVLCPDSSYIICTKYERKIIDTDSTIGEPAPSVTTESSKSKKDSKVNSKKTNKKTKKSVSIPSVVEPEVKKEIIYELEFQEFCVIEADGKKKYFCDGNFEEAEVLLIRTATDFNLGEVFSRRMDGTNLLYNQDGLLTVTFPNKTRIISSFYIDNEGVFPEWSEEEKTYFEIQEDHHFDAKVNVELSSLENGSTNNNEHSSIDKLNDNDEGYALIHLTFTIEHMNYATVTIDTGTQEFTVDTHNSVSVTVTDQAEYRMNLDQMTKITFHSDRLHMEYIACPESDCKTLCDINVSASDNPEESFWLHLKDSYGKDISVNYEGVLKLNEKNISQTDSQGEEVIENDSIQSNVEKLEECNVPCDKCRESHFVNQFRFFVLQKDLSLSELVHKFLIDNYKKNCNAKDWGSASNYNVFGDNRELLSILNPISYNESEKWLINSTFLAKPQNMVFKDLKSEEGKGFYQWMRPYERFNPSPRLPPPAVAPGPPKAFVLRTLERQWRKHGRENLKGARELIRAIIKYRRTMEEDKEKITADPIRDPRLEADIIQYQLVQDLAQRTIDKIQKKIEMHRQAEGENPKPLEFIRIPLQRDNKKVESEDDNTSSSKSFPESSKSSTNTAEEEENLVTELEVLAEMRPQLKRYWRHRAEKEKENQYFKDVLRHAYVPPYFENILFGGAAWWDVNSAVESAMDHAGASKKTVCYCCDEANNGSEEIHEEK